MKKNKHKHNFVPYKDIDVPTGKYRIGVGEVNLNPHSLILLDDMSCRPVAVKQKATIFYCTKCTKLKIRRWNEQKTKNN